MNITTNNMASMPGIHRLLLVVVLYFFMMGTALAAALGLPDANTARVGYLVGVTRFAMDDPNGHTKAVVDTLPLTLIYTNWLPHGWRYWAEAYFFTTSLDGNAGDIQQNVRRVGARISLQRNLHLWHWSFWLGAGLDVSNNKYTKRYSVDKDGFLLKTYPDRTDTAWGVNTQIISEWPLAQSWDLIAKLEHVFPADGGITETSLSAGILYRY